MPTSFLNQRGLGLLLRYCSTPAHHSGWHPHLLPAAGVQSRGQQLLAPRRPAAAVAAAAHCAATRAAAARRQAHAAVPCGDPAARDGLRRCAQAPAVPAVLLSCVTAVCYVWLALTCGLWAHAVQTGLTCTTPLLCPAPTRRAAAHTRQRGRPLQHVLHSPGQASGPAGRKEGGAARLGWCRC